ncbi:hypothetical protein [Bifidobacterium sp. ESL0790]|uniref:hypothetical protein n=1 Tax=Bifidobacterium sp. ESL0790 TaxID=2983233 RepID=UPI0023FA1D3D|nr:hypothetical protein [Bifidobacterium sp. ESL0790]WEV72131.1 hypothetical protein OZY47_06740 [Bifidobacterium sp. ESL0790]
MSKENNIDEHDKLLWIDIETTGLDPEHDRILEVEMRVTGMDATNVESRLAMVLPLDDPLMISRDALRMHTANGLIEAALAVDDFDLRQDKADLFNFVSSEAAGGRLHPAGSSVHFDIAFKAAGVELSSQEPTDHRAHTCLDRDIAEYQAMLRMLGWLRTPGEAEGFDSLHDFVFCRDGWRPLDEAGEKEYARLLGKELSVAWLKGGKYVYDKLVPPTSPGYKKYTDLLVNDPYQEQEEES